MPKCLQNDSKIEPKWVPGAPFFGFLGTLIFDTPLDYNQGLLGLGRSRVSLKPEKNGCRKKSLKNTRFLAKKCQNEPKMDSFFVAGRLHFSIFFGTGTQNAPKGFPGETQEAKSAQKGAKMRLQGLKNELKTKVLGF